MKNHLIKVIYEDNHLFVVNKPAGLATQPGIDNPNSLEGEAKEWIKEQYQKPGNVYLHALHRLDKPVSGLVLFARTSKALTRLNESIKAQDTQKVYFALVEGNLPNLVGSLEHYLVHDDYRARVVTASHAEGKRAKLTYQVVKSNGSLTLVRIELETGRYHQIRAQFSSIGAPIVGDAKYGSRLPFHAKTIALHHRYFEIPHPTTKKPILFEAHLPKYWPEI